MNERNRLVSIVRCAALALILQAAASAQFLAAPDSPVAPLSNPSRLAAGDFNEDGIADLAVLSTSASTVTILTGIGNGTFTVGTPISVGNAPVSLAVADVNNDGHLDLVVACQDPLMGSNVFILLGQGNGTFQPATTSYLVGQNPSYIVTGDFNDDNHPDLAVSDQTGGTVTVLLNDSMGGGNFSAQKPITVSVGAGPFSIATEKLNGTTYMAVANRTGNSVSLMTWGAGGATSVSGSPFAVIVPNPTLLTPNPSSVVLADFNGDGIPDIATANQGTNNISVLLSNNRGGYTPAVGSPFMAGMGTITIVTVDFNNDGAPDLAAVNGTDGTLTVLLGDGAGGFLPASGTQPSPGAGPYGMAVADFNEDGKLDLAIADNSAMSVTVLLNTFPVAFTMLSAASGTSPVAPGSIVSIYGTGLAAAGTAALASPLVPALPFSLGGANVTISDSTGAENALPLFYVSPSQINALIPTTVATGRATLAVFTGTASMGGAVSLIPVAPAIFTANQSGKGVAWAEFINSIYQITDVFQCPGGTPAAGGCIAAPLNVSASNCPPNGCELVLYGTGWHNTSTANVKVSIAGQEIQADYAGPSADEGEDQVNVALPATLGGSGLVSVMLIVMGETPTSMVTSNIVNVYIQ
jgi:uncharacterized protein (TIGR03437 family)